LLDLVHPDELIAELTARGPKVGADTGAWPGLTIYRFTGPARRMRGRVQSLLLVIVGLTPDVMGDDPDYQAWTKDYVGRPVEGIAAAAPS
jgi:hypothetical protein